MALLNPCMKFGIFLAKSILFKHYENGNKKISITCFPNQGFMQEKGTKKGFSKKAPARIEISCFALGSYEFLEHVEG